MRQEKIWGTTTEIFPASELYQIPIFAYHKVAKRFTWSQHRGTNVTINYRNTIFLENRSGIHYNLVQAIGKFYILTELHLESVNVTSIYTLFTYDNQ